MFRRVLILAALALGCGVSVSAQGYRIGDAQVVTSSLTSSSAITPLQATVNVCVNPANAVPCTNKASTFTSITLVTGCSAATQVVLAGTTTCVAQTDSRGNWGAWVAAGNYDVTFTLPTGQSFGPYTISVGFPTGTAISPGTVTSPNINTHLFLGNATYACSTAGLNAALAALPSGGGTVDMTPCNSISLAGPVVLGATVNQAVDLQMPYGVVTWTNCSGNGWVVNGIGSRLHGYGPIATIVNSVACFTGDYVHAEPPSGSLALTYVEIDHFRVDRTNCPSCIAYNVLSVRNPSSLHHLEERNGLGTAVQVTTSSLANALIPQGVSICGVYTQSGGGNISAPYWIITGAQIYPSCGSEAIITGTLGSFPVVEITPTNSTAGDAAGIHFSDFAIACAPSAPSVGLGLLVTSPAGVNGGAQENTFGPGITFEFCTTGWKVTGADASHKALRTVILRNSYIPTTTNIGVIDFATLTSVEENSNGNNGDITTTANSGFTRIDGELAGSPSDLTVAGTTSTLACYVQSNTPICTSGNAGAGGSYFHVDTIQDGTLNLGTSDNILSSLRLGAPIKNPTATATMGLALKKGSGGGNYTTASTTFVVADSTNLCFTVTIPTGWKLEVQASGSLATATAAVSANVALTDNASCSTANAGILQDSGPLGPTTAAGNFESFGLSWIIAGDGASHNIALQYKTSNAADSATLLNASTSQLPTMTFVLMPSN